MAYKDTKLVDVTRLTNDPNPNVVSYAIDSEFGWTTAVTPAKQPLVGYLWKTSEYPWFSVWYHVENGKPAARGLEFGTTGLHQPFPILIRKATIYGRPLLAFLDAGAAETRSYKMFLLKVPQNFSGVVALTGAGQTIEVKSMATTLTVR